MQVCSEEYDRTLISKPLIELVTRIQMAYQLQDVSRRRQPFLLKRLLMISSS